MTTTTPSTWPGMSEELNPFGVTEAEWNETAAHVAYRGTEEEQVAKAARFVHLNLCGNPANCEFPQYHDGRK